MYRTGFIFLLVPLFLFMFFPYLYCAQLPSDELQRSKYETQRQVSENAIDVTVWVFLSGRYKFFDLDVRDEVRVNLTISLTEPLPFVISAAIPFSLSEVKNLPPGASYTYGFWGYPPTGTLMIYLPANTSYSSIELMGYISGSSFFWRNTAETFFLNVTSTSTSYTSSYELVLVPPSASKVLKIYSYFYPDLRYREVSIGGQECIVISKIHGKSPIVILYEPKVWEPYALVLMIITVFMVYLVPYALKSRKIKNILLKFTDKFRELSPSKLKIILRRLCNEILKVDSSKLLTVYILCGILMTSLSFSVGPDPRLKVYVLASTPTTATTLSEFVHREVGAVAITVYDEMNEFKTLTNLGVFSTVIIGDFFPPTEKMVKDFIYPALDSAPKIIILEHYAFDVFSSEIQRRYADKTVVVEDLADLRAVLYRIPRRANALGLKVSPEIYISISAIIGLCSFILVFFGLAFLASKLIEVGKKPGVSGFPEAIAYAVLVFFFTQTTYIVCSVLLAMPLGLHTSSPKVTAVGFIGFSGGSRPRLLAGIAGFLFGSLISLKGGPKINKVGFASFLVLSFFILIDPLTSGIIFYEFILLFTVGPGMEHAYMAWSYVRAFIGSVADAFGAWISPTYAISLGIILYYASAVPFCLFPKLKKSTATVFLLFCAFCVSLGGLRVADMMPWKSIAGVIPGIVIGFFFATIFYLLSLAEGIVRRRIKFE